MNSKLIIKAGLLAGTLDIIAAFLNFYFKTGKNPTIVLKYIASAIFGKDAMTGGSSMVLIGLLLHFIIAFIFTIFFSVTYKQIWSRLQNTLLIAVLYGVFVWLVMNLAIVPLSKASQIPFSWSGAITNAIILIVCIGLPLSYLFRKKQPSYLS